MLFKRGLHNMKKKKRKDKNLVREIKSVRH